jgi:hypothetical protein
MIETAIRLISAKGVDSLSIAGIARDENKPDHRVLSLRES